MDVFCFVEKYEARKKLIKNRLYGKEQRVLDFFSFILKAIILMYIVISPIIILFASFEYWNFLSRILITSLFVVAILILAYFYLNRRKRVRAGKARGAGSSFLRIKLYGLKCLLESEGVYFQSIENQNLFITSIHQCMGGSKSKNQSFVQPLLISMLAASFTLLSGKIINYIDGFLEIPFEIRLLYILKFLSVVFLSVVSVSLLIFFLKKFVRELFFRKYTSLIRELEQLQLFEIRTGLSFQKSKKKKVT